MCLRDRKTPSEDVSKNMYTPFNNVTQADCLVDVPVLSLVGERVGLLVNIIANMGLMITAILGNVSILLSFEFVSSYVTNYLLLGLALTDLGVGLVVHPLYISVMLNVYTSSVPHCTVLVIYSISVSFLAGVSFLYIAMIGLDRFLAIRLHLRYGQIVTEKRSIITQVAVWIINGLLCLVWLAGFQVYSTLAAVVVAVSLFGTFAVYIRIYQVVKRHRAQIRDQMTVQLSEIEVSRLKRLRKSAVNTLYVFFVFVLCYLPFFVVTAINNMFKSSNTSVVLAYEFSVTLMLSNSSLNPLMYCLRLRDFRTAVKKTFKRIFCLGSEDE